MRGRRGIVLVLLGCLAAARAGLAMQEGSADELVSDDREAQQAEEKALGGVPRHLLDNTIIVAWNQRAYEIGFAEDQFLTFKAHRAFAMMHLAMHDALNAIVPVYRQYAYFGCDLFAHPIASAAQAAHDVLASQYPGEEARLDADLASWLSRVPDGEREKRGIALGREAAAAILAAREGDRWDFPGAYEFQSQPGAYQTTPPWNGFVAQPGFRFAKPFGLQAPEQFRPPPPPALDSSAYASAYNEVKEVGRVDSPVRTPDQTGYAIWWMEFAEGSVNRLARDLVERRRLHLWRTARLFALLNASLFDGYVATWDSKYEYDHWRPYTAIREAALDTNPATEPDSGWEPLRPTPPFPEYVSAHAAGCSAAFETLRRAFGNHVSFTMQTLTAPSGMPTRRFTSFRAAAAECADSRVRLGWHFRYATDAGLTLGRAVEKYLADNYLQPQRGAAGNGGRIK